MAIMDIALRTLLASPVSDETLEVLESLGPPRERLGRAEAFAQAALEAGAFRSAMATFLWLYENDNDPNRQLQNLARASVAAARAARSRRVHAHVPPARRAGGRIDDEAADKSSRQEDAGQGRGDKDDDGRTSKGDKVDRPDKADRLEPKAARRRA